MSRLDKTIVSLLFVILIGVFLFAACAPPEQYTDKTQSIQEDYSEMIGTPNSAYQTEILQVSDRVQVLRFYDPAKKTTCYLAIKSISCVK